MKLIKTILWGIGVLIVIVLFSQLIRLESSQEIVGPKLEAELQSTVTLSPIPEPEINVYPSDTLYQGETLRIEVESTDDSNPTLLFRDKEYKLFEYQGKLNAVIPVAVNAPAGESELKIGSKISTITILPGIFLIEEIGPFKPLTPAQVAQRQEETKSITAAYKTVAPTVYFDSAFVPPLANLFETSSFGIQRIIKTTRQPLEPHNGVDLRADVGTPVMAMNDGIVELAENYLLEGGFVILDHGLGINSVYLHLSKVNVKNGEQVEKGQVIGLSGGSGQSVGPHLHFMIKINGIAVDPLRFLDLWK